MLVSDEVHYTKIVGESIPDSVSSAVETMKKIVHDIINHSKTIMNKTHRVLLKSRIILAIYWQRVAERLAQAGIKDSKDDLWQSVLRFYRKDDHVFAQIDGNTLNYEYQYQGRIEILCVTDLTERNY